MPIASQSIQPCINVSSNVIDMLILFECELNMVHHLYKGMDWHVDDKGKYNYNDN
jgi:hypothetical protein